MNRLRTRTSGLPNAQYLLKRAILEGVTDNKFTAEDRKEALKFFGGCAFCGASKAPRNDHLVSVAECGDFIKRNVVPACRKCDESKGKKDFREWMMSNTPKSLSRRGLTKTDIKQRMRLIEKWQDGYKARTEKQLFGKDYARYAGILKKLTALCNEAEQLIRDVRRKRRATR